MFRASVKLTMLYACSTPSALFKATASDAKGARIARGMSSGAIQAIAPNNTTANGSRPETATIV